MLTPYELGREIGQRHGQRPESVISEARVEQIADMIGINEVEFLEGFRNGFAQEKGEMTRDENDATGDETDPRLLLKNWELEEGGKLRYLLEDTDLTEIDESQEAYRQMAYDESAAIQSQRF